MTDTTYLRPKRGRAPQFPGPVSGPAKRAPREPGRAADDPIKSTEDDVRGYYAKQKSFCPAAAGRLAKSLRWELQQMRPKIERYVQHGCSKERAIEKWALEARSAADVKVRRYSVR